MKGIILAGGMGTRLYPTTKNISKHLLLIYDKPMVYYPLSVLTMIGIRDILIISTPEHIGFFKTLFTDCRSYGLNISYAVQEAPKGIAEAFIIGESFIDGDDIAFILGDNFFYSQTLHFTLQKALHRKKKAAIFGYPSDSPQNFGVVEFDNNKNIISIEEKPSSPKSNFVVPGLYFYNSDVVKITKMLNPSNRRELEITDVNKQYLEQNELELFFLDDDCIWFDMGTPDDLLRASNFVMKQQLQGEVAGNFIEV